VFRWSGRAVIGATTTNRILTQKNEFSQVQEAWAVRNLDFALLLQRYKKAVAKMRSKPTLKHWRMDQRTLDKWPASERPFVLQMKKMSRRCKVNPLPTTHVHRIIHYYIQ
jgi:hypothetical protein